ncbi:putative anti-repressor protein [Rodentibacter pneumotropicus]|uniref:Putative anti-repressor protein n=1 Tax=Rodentibacter pneumotropicus TaxID=758 RepID=A0A448MNH5_9PAST|nr:putative anti-repressor protein [Rodentibacter pneumotropicus]
MTNQIQFQSFNFNANAVRVITDPTGEFWFCGSDVCYILGYKNAPDALTKHCKQGGIAKRYTPTQSGEQEMIFINEPNLYRLIIKSRKPEAEPFEAWVFEEVLPQIRKTGKYQLEPKQLALPEPEKKFTFEFTEHELQQLSWSWFALLRCTEMCRVLEPALRQIGSSYAATVRDLGREYAYSIRQSHHTLSRITEQFQADQITNWRVLRHLRNYDPKKIGFQLDIL